MSMAVAVMMLVVAMRVMMMMVLMIAMMRVVVVMIVRVMMTGVAMAVIVRLMHGRIGAAFGIERRLDLDHARAQSLHHRLDDMIPADAQAFSYDLRRQM